MGGEPGIGKSTLLLQTALNCNDKRVLYVSGEESAQQIKMRSKRINKNNGNCYVLIETEVENIVEKAKEVEPQIIIIDSIQTMYIDEVESTPGSIAQVRAAAYELIKLAKKKGFILFLVGPASVPYWKNCSSV